MSRAPRRAVDDEDEEERRVRAVFPIQVQNFVTFLKSARDWLTVRARERQVSVEDVQMVADLAIAALTPWLTDAGMVVTIGDPEAFVKDVKRKLVGIAVALRSIVERELQSCVEAQRRMRGDVIDEETRKLVSRCKESLRKARHSLQSFLMAVDVLFGVIQANLPAGMMSNVIKGHAGFITD